MPCRRIEWASSGRCALVSLKSDVADGSSGGPFEVSIEGVSNESGTFRLASERTFTEVVIDS